MAGNRNKSGHLVGPASNWLKCREARDRKLAKPKRNPGVKRMNELRKQREGAAEGES